MSHPTFQLLGSCAEYLSWENTCTIGKRPRKMCKRDNSNFFNPYRVIKEKKTRPYNTR